ncbi:hypothetical protein R1flu_006025 [Riccia fluitans]|uniref:Uncharacterized protein n=1 Tax=Riccia fluitans TaxID=41844 RepID=A0ABD1YUU9_9MARC
MIQVKLKPHVDELCIKPCVQLCRSDENETRREATKASSAVDLTAEAADTSLLGPGAGVIAEGAGDLSTGAGAGAMLVVDPDFFFLGGGEGSGAGGAEPAGGDGEW